MKLSPAQVQRVQLEMDAEALPEQHGVTPDLRRTFGDHTFFLDDEGLSIVEASSEDRHVGNVVKIARWADAAHTTLKIQPPQPMPRQVELASDDDRGEMTQ